MPITVYCMCLRNKVEEEVTASNAYANEPKRSPALNVLTETPFNAETPIDVVEAQDVTPVEMHFKRHHLPVPLVEVACAAGGLRGAC